MALYVLYLCNIHRILVKIFDVNKYKRYLAIIHKVVHLKYKNKLSVDSEPSFIFL